MIWIGPFAVEMMHRAGVVAEDPEVRGDRGRADRERGVGPRRHPDDRVRIGRRVDRGLDRRERRRCRRPS